MYNYRPTQQQVKALRQRMRNGTGASKLLQAEDAPTHYLDSLERFRKDFAQYDREKRQAEKTKRQIDLEKKRLEQLQRQNRRWENYQNYTQKLKQRQQINAYNLRNGIKRSANSTSLAYNPINLSYDNNGEGDRLRMMDEDAQVRRFVRARNMEDRGNSKYNPINGENREGIQKIIPPQLTERYQRKLQNHYDHVNLKIPSSTDLSNVSYRNNFNVSNIRYF